MTSDVPPPSGTNSSSAAISELGSPEELREAFPVMRQLRPHLNEAEFVERVGSMRRTGGYRLFALRETTGGAIVALAGVAVQDTLYQGKHVWVYDLVTDSGQRSHGYGRALLNYLEQFARENGCTSIGLVSGTQRIDAHRFYEEHMGYRKTCYQFEKTIGE